MQRTKERFANIGFFKETAKENSTFLYTLTPPKMGGWHYSVIRLLLYFRSDVPEGKADAMGRKDLCPRPQNPQKATLCVLPGSGDQSLNLWVFKG